MRAIVLATGLGILAGCSSTDLAMLNVALDEANGTYWPDQSQSQSMVCGSGNGYLMEYSGVSGGQGYIYFTSHTNAYADVTVTYEDGDVHDVALSPGETSYTIYNHPGYSWEVSWGC